MLNPTKHLQMDFSNKASFLKTPQKLLAQRRPSIFLLAVFYCLFNLSSVVAQTAPFVTEWTTTALDESITIPTTGSGYDYLIDWGDGIGMSTIGPMPAVPSRRVIRADLTPRAQMTATG